jgi:gamma-glutamyltranspeptidase / glutathione hydrolase
MKLALADRDVYYADPLSVDVPTRELLAHAYAKERRNLIDPNHASLEQRPGDPRSGKALLAAAEAKHGLGGPASDTTTCVVADSHGNMIAATPSGWTGSLAGDTGVWLGSRLQSFNLWPDHPNCLEPGKRPRITLTPTIVLKDGKPVLAISVAGGDGQDQATLQMLVSAIDFGLQPADAVTTLRFGTQHHVGSFLQTPAVLGSLSLDEGADAKLVEALKQKGHKVELVKVPQWNPIMLSVDPQSKLIRAAGDSRAKRHAAAY